MINWKLFFIAVTYILAGIFTLDNYDAPWWIKLLFIVVSAITIRVSYQLGRIKELDNSSVKALWEMAERRACQQAGDSDGHMVVEEAPDDV